MVVIEYHKRGLPHAHILLILRPEDRPRNTDDYDKLVCAELPDPSDTVLFPIIDEHQMHGPCGQD